MRCVLTMLLIAAAGSAAAAEPVSSRLIRTLIHPDREMAILKIDYAQGGRYLVGGSYEGGRIQIWDGKSGEPLHTIETGMRGQFDYFALSPDGTTLYVAIYKEERRRETIGGQRVWRYEFDGEIQCWDVKTARKLKTLACDEAAGVYSLRPVADGKTLLALERVAADNEDGSAEMLTRWNLADGSRERMLDGYWTASPGPGGLVFAATCEDVKHKVSRIKLFDLRGNEKVAIEEADGVYYGRPAFSPDGSFVACHRGMGDSESPQVKVWDVKTGKEIWSFGRATRAWYFNEVAFSPDGTRLAVTHRDGQVIVYDVEHRRIVWTRMLENNPGLRGPVFSPDGRRLAMAGQRIPPALDERVEPGPFDLDQPRVYLFDAETGENANMMIASHGYVGQLRFHPDGSVLALGGYGAVCVFDVSR